MAASVFARTLPASLSSRTIVVKCKPAPANFTERRAVLKALATTTANPKIEVFKRLADSSSFIAVTATAATASALVNESPFKRIVHTEDSATAAIFSTTAWGSGARTTITDPVIVRTPTQASEDTGSSGAAAKREELGLKTRTFTIHIFPANVAYNHKRVIGRNPLHGPWPTQSGGSTYMSAALRKVVPANAMAPALRDWETGQQLLGDSVGLEEGYVSAIFGASSDRAFVEERLRKKKLKEIPDIMRSLSAVAEASRKAAEASQKAAGTSQNADEPPQEASTSKTEEAGFKEAAQASRNVSASSEAETSFEAKFSQAISTASRKSSRDPPASF